MGFRVPTNTADARKDLPVQCASEEFLWLGNQLSLHKFVLCTDV